MIKMYGHIIIYVKTMGDFNPSLVMCYGSRRRPPSISAGEMFSGNSIRQIDINSNKKTVVM